MKKKDSSAIPKYDLEKHYRTVLPLGPLKREDESTLTGTSPAEPGVEEGQLPNGLRYFIGQCRKPENRAALFLAVDVGSVFGE